MKTSILALLCATAAAVGAAQPASAARADLVVTPAWLAEHLRDADLVVLHVGDKKTYDAGHVPGARFVNVSTDLAVSDPTGKGLTLEMLPVESLRDRLAALGIGDASRVVVVQSDDWWSPSARLMFTLDYAGLTRTAWLDGGLTAWKAAGHPVTADVPAASNVRLSPLKTQPLIVDADFVRAHEHAAGYALVDARATGFYDGSQPGGQRNGPHKSGHIPGAVNLPYSLLVSDDVHLKSPEELEKVFDEAGVKRGDTVVAYCHIGQQATAVLFAARTLGHRVLLYDGSFEDWARRDLPVETATHRKAP